MLGGAICGSHRRTARREYRARLRAVNDVPYGALTFLTANRAGHVEAREGLRDARRGCATLLAGHDPFVIRRDPCRSSGCCGFNAANVTIYGLFVEHFQQLQVLWNGNGGRVVFYPSEIPYDPPDQASWRSASGVDGWASYKVADSVTSHEAWGLGIYSVFTNPNVLLTRAVEVPNTASVKFHHLTTVNLTNNGGISNVIDNTGGATAPGIAVNTPRVTDFP